MPGHLESVLTVQQRITTLAQRSPEFAFFSLAHYIDLDWLGEAYHRTRKDGCAGIDEVTGKQYAENLKENLQNLLDRLKSGTYKAPPVKRKHRLPLDNNLPTQVRRAYKCVSFFEVMYGYRTFQR